MTAEIRVEVDVTYVTEGAGIANVGIQREAKNKQTNDNIARNDYGKDNRITGSKQRKIYLSIYMAAGDYYYDVDPVAERIENIRVEASHT